MFLRRYNRDPKILIWGAEKKLNFDCFQSFSNVRSWGDKGLGKIAIILTTGKIGQSKCMTVLKLHKGPRRKACNDNCPLNLENRVTTLKTAASPIY